MSVVNNRFYGTTALTKTGSTGNYNYGNGFHGATTLTQSSSTAGLYWSNSGRDTSFAALTLVCSGSQPHTIANAYDFIVMGDLTVNRTGSGALTLAASNLIGKTRFEGGANQTFTPTGSAAALCYKAVVNKSAGTLSLASDLEVNNDITLTSGVIKTTGSAVLKLRDNATVTGANDASHVEGRVLKVGNDAFTFPVGRNGAYRPIAISAPSSTTAEFRGEYFEKSADPVYDLDSRDTTLHGISANEYWTLERLSSTNNVSVTVKWDTLTSCSMTSPITDVRVAGWDTGTSKWKDWGNASTSGNMVEGTVTSGSAVSAFSAFTVGHRYEEMGCRELSLEWSPDTLIVDSIAKFFVACDNVNPLYRLRLSLANSGFSSSPAHWDSLDEIDTVTSAIHANLPLGTTDATLYVINQHGAVVDSLQKAVPYKRSILMAYICELNTPECEHIQNGNFASYQQVPVGPAQINKVDCWNKYNDPELGCMPIDWELCTSWSSTTDFYQAGATNLDFSVPDNIASTVPVNSLNLTTNDDSYVGVLAMGGSLGSFAQCEYLLQELAEPLTTGVSYRFRMFVNLGDQSSRTVIPGVMFSMGPECQDGWNNINVNAVGQANQYIESIPDPNTGYLITCSEWHEVEIDFVATDDWEHITIGRFTNEPLDLGTNIWETTGNITFWDYACYWLIDEVSLTPLTTCCTTPEFLAFEDDELVTTPGNVTTLTDGMTISGILNLSGGGEFVMDNANVIMEPGAQINVNANTKLTITNNTRIHSCTEMWNMIWVRPTAEIVVDEGSLIEDAKTGIYLDNNSLYTLDNARLNKNYYHMMRPASFGGASSSGTITSSSFTCQTTESLWLGGSADHTNLLVPHDQENTYIGIANYATPMAGVPNSNTLTVGGVGQGNLFDHARFGIYTIGNLDCQENRFSNMWISPSLTDFNEGSGIYSINANNLSVTDGNSFRTCFTGVNSFKNVNVSIDDNAFEQSPSGIRVRGPRTNKVVDIVDNELSGVSMGIFCQDNVGATITIGTPTQPNQLDISSYSIFGTQVGSGIFVEELTQSLATLIRTENNNVNDAYHGIHYRNMLFNDFYFDSFSGIFSNTVYVHDGPYGGTFPYGNPFGIKAEVPKNITIQNNYITPMATTNWNKSGIVVTGQSEAEVWCNTMEGILIGLQYQGVVNSRTIRNLWLDAYYGLVLNTGTMGDIGDGNSTPATPWDNQWDGVVFYDTYAHNSNASNATIYYRSAGGNYQPVNNGANISLVNSFGVLPTSGTFTDFDCDENGSVGLAPLGEVRAMMRSALTDTATLPVYEAELRWQQKQQMYEQIVGRDSIAQGDSLLTAFFDSCHAANIGILDRATKARTELNKPETLEVYLDTLNGMTTAILPEAALRDVLIVLLEKDIDTTTVVDSVSHRLSEVLNTLFPDSTFEATRVKYVSYNHVQDSTLHHLAEQCPMEFGRAVLLARTALGINDTIPYTQVHECEIMDLPTSERRGDEDQEEESGPESHANYSTSVNPNPAKDLLSISVNDIEESAWRIELFTPLGQRVVERELKLGQNPLDISTIQGGIYYWRIFRKGRQIDANKVIIVK